MFDNSDINRDLLPVYPSSIQGELRIILQVKDEFLLCFKHLESLRNLWDQQTRIITKEFIIEQIKNGESEIEILESELSIQKEMLSAHERHNDVLINELKNHGETLVAGSSKRRIKICRTSLFKSCHGNLNDPIFAKDSSFISVLENIASKIDNAQNELKDNIRPLLEFYKDVFYLQLHFTLALAQISCYCMPLMTDSVGIIDRLFFWTERPEFELIRKSGPICDRLRDIYTRLQRILGRLLDSVIYLQDRIDLQRLLEINFYDKVRQLGQMKQSLLEEIHNLRLNLDLYEEENDRLLGTLAKIDPNYVKRDGFNHLTSNENLINSTHNNAPSTVKHSQGSNKILDHVGTVEITKPIKKSKVTLMENSENVIADSFRSVNNANDKMNASNVHINLSQRSNPKISQSTKMVKMWRENAYKLLSKMRKSRSSSDPSIFEFNTLNIISERSRLLSNNITKKSEKYLIHMNDDFKDSSDPNQTTDALVLTSDILPKDN